jgi:hypothetical protein
MDQKTSRDFRIWKVRNMAICFRKTVTCISLAALSGCALGGKEGHPSHWDTYVRLAALETYVYAQMATNAYLTPDCVKGTGAAACAADKNRDIKFDLGSDIKVLHAQCNDQFGFAYVVFARQKAGRTREIIIAYRGTDDYPDWEHGNLKFTQNRLGLELYQVWKKKAQAMGGDVAVSVTGHSLGGAIATYVSMVEEGATCYVFNASPRFRREATPVPDNRRVSVVEYGEINKVLRLFGRSPTQIYISVGCSRGGPIGQHSMRKLAVCLTKAAAWEFPKLEWTPANARASLIRNSIPLPDGLGAAPSATF